MWIQLISAQHLDLGGVQRTYYPGDWVDVGRQFALKLIASGQAKSYAPVVIEVSGGGGILLRRDEPNAWAILKQWKLDGQAELMKDGEMPFDSALVWDPAVKLRVELLDVGFKLLGRWEAAIPLLSYDRLARDLGDEADRARTAEVLPDLRVPVYDTRFMFLRKCPAVERVLRLWREGAGDERLCFMRAVYQVKPLILPLPTTWTGASAETGR